ncbi:hypothetical protein CMI37_36930 [Candidatus Pacearchaeota archaeon]|nr:hypothetical protein [Candidatus Pacearchaeota archaeon]|tara:strand:+ start:1586 stop:1801 length:216 start_codon:yes stop_codon:yes gene_type:complete
MNGLQKLLKSKRFATAIVAVAVLVLVDVFGVEEELAAKIAETVIKLALTLIGGISVSDFALALKGLKKDPE